MIGDIMKRFLFMTIIYACIPVATQTGILNEKTFYPLPQIKDNVSNYVSNIALPSPNIALAKFKPGIEAVKNYSQIPEFKITAYSAGLYSLIQYVSMRQAHAKDNKLYQDTTVRDLGCIGSSIAAMLYMGNIDSSYSILGGVLAGCGLHYLKQKLCERKHTVAYIPVAKVSEENTTKYYPVPKNYRALITQNNNKADIEYYFYSDLISKYDESQNDGLLQNTRPLQLIYEKGNQELDNQIVNYVAKNEFQKHIDNKSFISTTDVDSLCKHFRELPEDARNQCIQFLSESMRHKYENISKIKETANENKDSEKETAKESSKLYNWAESQERVTRYEFMQKEKAFAQSDEELKKKLFENALKDIGSIDNNKNDAYLSFLTSNENNYLQKLDEENENIDPTKDLIKRKYREETYAYYIPLHKAIFDAIPKAYSAISNALMLLFKG